MSEQPYIIVSTDSHVSPSMKTQLRKFCPPDYLAQYDAFVAESEAQLAASLEHEPPASEKFIRCKERMRTARGVQDPQERLAVMDEQGIAAEVMFAGSGNGEKMPFVGSGLNAGDRRTTDELIAVGCRIWNDGLAEFCSADPGRLMGVMQIPIWDIPGTVAEVRRSRANGLHVMNLPAPRTDYPPYTRPDYEPLWDVCEELGVTLVTHSGGGERPLGENEDIGFALVAMETHWLSRRNLWQMVLGGVFERHPELRLVFTEQRTNWVTETVRDLDSAWSEDLEYHLLNGRANRDDWFHRSGLSKKPSEYWAQNCFVGASFLAAYEAARFHEVGMQNVMWGSDYPHMEGTWPATDFALRNTFAGLPEADVRKMLGETGVGVYHLDAARMRAIADKIGPTPSALNKPLGSDDIIPENRSYAFREFGTWA